MQRRSGCIAAVHSRALSDSEKRAGRADGARRDAFYDILARRKTQREKARSARENEDAIAQYVPSLQDFSLPVPKASAQTGNTRGSRYRACIPFAVGRPTGVGGQAEREQETRLLS